MKAIQELKIGDEVICYNNNFEQEIHCITGICAFIVDATMHITTQNNISIITGLMERFYLPCENQWVCAKDLKQGDFLLNENLEYIAITYVEQHENKDIMYFISVEQQHNFLVSQGKYLVHNGPLGATIGCYVGASAVVLAYAGISGLLTLVTGPANVVVMPLWYHWTAVPLAGAVKVGGLAGGIALGAV